MLGRVGVGAAQHEDHVRPGGARGPQLLAGDDDLVAVDHATGRTPARSEPWSGSEKPWQYTSSPEMIRGRKWSRCSARTVDHDRRADHVLAEARGSPGRPAAVQLLGEDRRSGRRRSPAAELLRPPWTDQLGLKQPPLPLGVERAVRTRRRSRRRPAGIPVAFQSVSSARPSGALSSIHSRISFRGTGPPPARSRAPSQTSYDRVTTSTSKASTSEPSTHNGLTSIARAGGPSAKRGVGQRRDRLGDRRARRPGPAARPAQQRARRAARRASVRTSSAATGSARRLTSRSTSTHTPPRPTASTGRTRDRP